MAQGEVQISWFYAMLHAALQLAWHFRWFIRARIHPGWVVRLSLKVCSRTVSHKVHCALRAALGWMVAVAPPQCPTLGNLGMGAGVGFWTVDGQPTCPLT